MKRAKIILLATLGVCMFSFIPTVLGAANVRPISDFTDTNDYTGVAAWLDPESNLIVFPHGFYVTPPGTEKITDCIHHGSVLERDLKDGRILYKVNLHVKGAMMLIAYYGDRMIFIGEMDYSFTVTMIVQGVLGGPVPNILDVLIFGGGEGTFIRITGKGTGTFIDDIAAIEQGFAPGATAKVKINQVGILDPEGDKYPVEFIFFH
jgi:hypothetical protein